MIEEYGRGRYDLPPGGVKEKYGNGKERLVLPGEFSLNKISRIFLSLGVFACFFFDYSGDVHWPPWAMLSVLIALYMTARMCAGRALPLAPNLLFGTVLINGLIWMSWRPLTASLDFQEKVSLRSLAAHAMVEFLLLSTLFYRYWRRVRHPVAQGLYWGGLAHAFWLIFDQTIPKFITLDPHLFNTHGLLGNRSIGASFTAAWLFSSIHWILGRSDYSDVKKEGMVILTFLLGVPAILISVSSISYGALILASFATLLASVAALERSSARQGFKNRKLLRTSLYVTLPAFALLGALGSYVDPEWYHHISRYDAWPMFYKYFKDQGDLLFGAGAGSFKYFGPLIQDQEKFMMGKWWLWAHNDWLQIIFEYGYVTFALAIATFLGLLIASWRRPFLFGAVTAYGAIMIGNYPLHIAMTSLLAFWIAFEVWWGKKNR